MSYPNGLMAIFRAINEINKTNYHPDQFDISTDSNVQIPDEFNAHVIITAKSDQPFIGTRTIFYNKMNLAIFSNSPNEPYFLNHEQEITKAEFIEIVNTITDAKIHIDDVEMMPDDEWDGVVNDLELNFTSVQIEPKPNGYVWFNNTEFYLARKSHISSIINQTNMDGLEWGPLGKLSFLKTKLNNLNTLY